MNREHAVTGVLAFLALLALGGAGATLDAAAGGGGAGGSGGEGGVGVGTDERFSLGFEGGNVSVSAGNPFPPWVYELALVLLALGFVAGVYLFYRDHGLQRMAALSGLLAGVFLAVYYLFSSLDPSDPTGNETGGFLDEVRVPGGAPAGQESAQTAANDPPTALLVLLGVVLLGAVAVIVRSSGDQTVEFATVDEETESDVTAVAEAAGRAADRIDEDADLDNAVYRAWREMTTHLPVENPASSTPAEFADAAVEAGMDREDVTELTRLFEAVRYGDGAVTAEREARAVAALRNIERTYADVSTEGVAADDAGDAAREDRRPDDSGGGDAGPAAGGPTRTDDGGAGE